MMDIVILLCLLIFLIGVGIFLLARDFSAGRKKDSKIPFDASAGTSSNGWKSWIPYFGIALILAIGTIWGALFFLGVVWLLRKNPASDPLFNLTNNEKKTAGRIYTWLFFSSVITVPIFIGAAFNVYGSATFDERVMAALIPLVVHVPLLLGLTSKSIFVYRHTQQGILLIALRAGMASLAMGYLNHDGLLSLAIFFFGNGTLWLVGSIVGWSQISNGKCWFMESKGEKLISSESAGPEKPETPVMDRELDDMLKSLDSKGILAAKQKALHAFQTGTPAIKKRAVEVLFKLGEVEKF